MDDTSSAVADAPSSSPAPSSAPSSSESTSAPTTDRPSIGEGLAAFNEAAKITGRKQRGLPAQPTEQPAADGTPAQTAPAARGPVPTEVHIKAVENARVKARTEAEQEFRSTVGADPQVAAEATRWFTRAANDRVGFLRDVINEALTDPELGPQIRSLAGKTLGGGRQPAQHDTPSEMPQPDFQDANGNQFYSARQMQALDAWRTEQLKAEILGQVQPDLEQVRSEREQRQQELAQHQTRLQIQSHISEAKAWPHFEQFKEQIAEAARAMPLTSGHPAEEAIVLRRAYDKVVGPELTRLSQEAVMKNLKERANASSLNPASTGAPSGVPKNVRAKDGGSFANALKWAESQQSGR